MFSTGQKIFAIFFIIVFTIIMVYTYRKDIYLHKIYYKRVWVVLVGILAVAGAFALIAHLLD